MYLTRTLECRGTMVDEPGHDVLFEVDHVEGFLNDLARTVGRLAGVLNDDILPRARRSGVAIVVARVLD